jgi:hypothetical protein
LRPVARRRTRSAPSVHDLRIGISAGHRLLALPPTLRETGIGPSFERVQPSVTQPSRISISSTRAAPRCCTELVPLHSGSPFEPVQMAYLSTNAVGVTSTHPSVLTRVAHPGQRQMSAPFERVQISDLLKRALTSPNTGGTPMHRAK